MSKTAARSPAAGKWLKHLLLQMVDRASFDADDLREHPETALHRLRLRMKKADALLRLARGVISKDTRQQLRKEIKQIKNAGGDQRDAEVVAKLVAKLSDGQTSSTSPALPPPQAFKASQIRQIQRWLTQLRQHLAHQDFHPLTWDDIQANHATCYRQGRRRMRQAEASQDPEDFHEWRKRVKALHYQSQALHAALIHPRLHRTRKLGKLLGREQDLTLLEETFHEGKSAAHWQALIATHRKKLRPQILKHGTRLFADSPRKFARWEGLPA